MIFEFIAAIILSIILAIISFYIFNFTNAFFDIQDEEIEKPIPLSTKFEGAAIDLVSLCVAHFAIKLLGIKGLIYKLLPSRCDNMYVESILFVLLVIPLMLAISRFVITKCANAAALNATEFEYLIPVLASIPTVILGVSVTIGLGYALVAYVIPLYIVGFLASFFVFRLFL